MVAGCDVHHYARWHRTYRPGLWFKGVGNSFLRNRVSEAPHVAIWLAMGGRVIK